MKTRITKADTIRALNKAVREYGEDWVDPRAASGNCTNEYEHKGEVRNCIAGHVYRQWGWDFVFESESLVDTSVHDVFWEIADGWAEDIANWDIDPEVKLMLQKAQNEQDGGSPWGEVLEEVKEEYWND